MDAQLAAERPDTNTGWTTDVSALSTFVAGSRATTLRMFLAAAMFLQILGCANVAALLIARASERRRERALRVALGATRQHTVTAGLVEAGLLAGLASLGGLWLVSVGLSVLDAVRPAELAGLTFDPDWRVWAFVAGTSGASALLFGLWPMLEPAPVEVAAELAHGGRTATQGSGQLRRMHVLLGVEVALAVMLCLGAGALARGVWQMQRVDIGSTTANVLTFGLNPPNK
jgi:putative ABC transport system permease protein